MSIQQNEVRTVARRTRDGGSPSPYKPRRTPTAKDVTVTLRSSRSSPYDASGRPQLRFVARKRDGQPARKPRER